MTTTAHAVPSLEVSAPDDNMDVLSDTGFDFGDGDIDLDLDTAPSVHDDDMSLNDAATDGGIDMDEPSADQDDFMADHGDLIEEDDVYDDDGAAAVVSQSIDDSAPTFEADMLAPPDEDLIDYSDDEAQEQVKLRSPSGHKHEGEDEDPQTFYDVEATTAPVDVQHQHDSIQGEPESVEPAEVIHREIQVHADDGSEAVERTETSHEHQAVADDLLREEFDEENMHTGDGGGPLPTDEQPDSADDDAGDDVSAEEQAVSQPDAGNASDSDHHDDQQIGLRPVTVNYAGNELWLFKQHDLDESGDFLLEDLSVAKSSISDLFQACRLSLGDDVSGEHEIGFRFDHLHNLELYEDNTACVAVSLERLIDLYHTLQTQDGNEDPECFYVTLQFRPRFVTLLADVAQYAEQGSGYSALDAAVAAGETHFSNVFSGASTEHEPVDWDEENDDEDGNSPCSIRSTALDGAEASEHDEQRNEEVDTQEEEQEEGPEEHQHGINLKGDRNQTPGIQDVECQPVQEIANSGSPQSTSHQAPHEYLESALTPESAAVERHNSDSDDERTPDQIAHDKQEADDFVDYSDAEDDLEAKSAPAHEPSPSSSTVQGDEPTEFQRSRHDPEHDVQNSEHAAETGFDEHDDDATLLTQTQYGDDVNHYAFQDYTETYGQRDSFQEYQAEDTAGDSFDANGAYNDDTNQGFTDYNFQDLEAEVNLGFGEQPLDEAKPSDHGNEAFEAVEDVTHADTFLDLDYAPEWAVDADPAPNLPGKDAILLHDNATSNADDEGGAVEQPVATSSAADLVSTSSNDHEALSPQGQKRSIDEVGKGIDDAPDATDVKRLRV